MGTSSEWAGVMDLKSDRPRIIATCVVLGLLTLAAYSPVGLNGFINFDDPDYITANPAVLAGLTPAGIVWAFTTSHASNWHPLTWISHMLDVQCFGLHAGAHHFVSVLLHVANAVLLLLFLKRLTGGFRRSAIVAFIFALHPLHVESVAWAAERKDVLSSCFFLLTLLAYIRYVSASAERRALSYTVTLLLFAAGLLCKSMLVTLPFVLLLLDYWPLRRFSFPGVVKEKIPFFLLAAGSSIVTFLVQQRAGAVSPLAPRTLSFGIGNAPIAYVRYLAKTFWPQDLAAFYPAPAHWPIGLVLGAAGLVTLISGVTLWQLRQRPFLAVGWAWFLGMLVPVIGLVQAGEQAMADRYTYLPMIGLSIAVVWGCAEFAAARPTTRSTLTALLIGVLLMCGVLTWKQVRYWRSSETLFAHALAAGARSSMALNNLGIERLNAGDWAGAEPLFTEAIERQPRNAKAIGNLGICRQKQGRLDEAVEQFRRALALRPLPEVYCNLGNVLMIQNHLPEAEARYREAIALQPTLPEAWFCLGNLKSMTGDHPAAADAFRQAAGLNPNYGQAQLRLGKELMELRRFDEAIPRLQAGLELLPANAAGHTSLALALASTGRLAEAQAHYAEACRLEPTNFEAQRGLGLAYYYQGDLAHAVPQLEKVLQGGADPKTHYFAGLAYLGLGAPERALPHLREAVRIAPHSPAYLHDLAWLLATCPVDALRNGSEALRLAQQLNPPSAPRDPRLLDALDAAYAETGQFELAAATASAAREAALAAGQKELATAAEARIALYRAGKPCRQLVSPSPAR